MAQRYWSISGRYLGQTTYGAAVGGNANITVGSNYYYYATSTPIGWHVGQKRSGNSPGPEQGISADRLPRAVQQNAQTSGTNAGLPKNAVPGNPTGSVPPLKPPVNPVPKATSCYTRMLRQGSFGGDVLWVQQKLTLIGNYTGSFDSATTNAVKNFQSRTGLTADGVVGPKTACKLGMSCVNCGGTTPKPPSGGGTPGTGTPGGGSTPTPTTPPKPKPEPPYKLPRYLPPTSDVVDFNPISTSDLIWAQWGVFNAYELARVSHNQYFETIQPDYNVISNVTSSLIDSDETLSLIDDSRIADFATPDFTQDMALLAFGTAKLETATNRALVYGAVRTEAQDLVKQARLLGVKFLRSTTSISIDDEGPFLVSYITRRIGKYETGPGSSPIKLTATAKSNSTIALSWSPTNSYAQEYELYRMSQNGTPHDPPVLIGTFPKTTTIWTSPVLPANTIQSYLVKGFMYIDDINTPGSQIRILVGTSNEAQAITPNIGLSAAAPLTKVRPIHGKLVVRFAVPSPSTYFSYVKFTYKEGAMPTSINDGTVTGAYYAASANTDIILKDIGLTNRPNNRTFYVRCWTFNTANQQSTTNSSGSAMFLRNPVIVNRIDVDSWRNCGTTRWEPGYARMRVSNYGTSSACSGASPKYSGLWFYGNALKTASAGRTVTATRMLVLRADGGSGGPIHMYIGQHAYQTHPTTNTEPVFSGVAQTPETIARNSEVWVNMNRFNSYLTAQQVTGFGMYRRVAEVYDLETFVGQSDANGNAYARDGQVQITHRDFDV